MAKEPADRDVRLQIMLQPQELEAIEEWRFAKRMPSRAAAVRELLRRGLQAEGFDIAPTASAQAHSAWPTSRTAKRVNRSYGLTAGA